MEITSSTNKKCIPVVLSSTLQRAVVNGFKHRQSASVFKKHSHPRLGLSFLEKKENESFQGKSFSEFQLYEPVILII